MQVLKVMARVLVPSAKMDATVAFYERLLGEKCAARFGIPELRIEIASVGGMHILGGSDADLAPFSKVGATYFVDSVTEYCEMLGPAGVSIVQQPQQGPFGKFMIARHPDGLIVEYGDNVAAAP